MAQSLEVNIKTTSDVPQAMDKAKSATVSFGKQVEDIQKKFSTAFKDIFLGFTAPMVLLQSAISYITNSIEKAKQAAKEGRDLMISGEDTMASIEERKMAAFFSNRKRMEELDSNRREARIQNTQDFLESEAGGPLLAKLIEENAANYLINPRFTYNMSTKLDVQRRAAEEFAKTPQGMAELKAKQEADKVKTEPPLGAGVIGVGASPQIALAQEANDKLSQIESHLGKIVNDGEQKDPTKPLGRKYPLYSPGLQR